MRILRLLVVGIGIASAILAGCSRRTSDDTPPRAQEKRLTKGFPVPPSAGPPRVFVYFTRGDSCAVYPVPRTIQGGSWVTQLRLTLEALLAGPTAEERANGFTSAFPDTLEILRHRMRFVSTGGDSPHEGKYVAIQSIEERPDGIVRVSFSKELNAYDHGANRVCAIRKQVQETVKQFEEWQGVSIAVDGKTEGVLQP